MKNFIIGVFVGFIAHGLMLAWLGDECPEVLLKIFNVYAGE